ncbi:MAG: hypothetical protein M1818_003934 [Claussenomyces sp. TS43310]|nr:MAG: hypothetical protein M1818_003934 [Claussenomyces sp. TS43310]
MSGQDTGNNIALTALVISLIALFTTVAQVAQQYITTASEGYRRCQKSVMGLWAKKTKRRFKLGELRFEVLFETPVLFLARPENKRGPIPGRKICRIDGSSESYAETRTVPPAEEQAVFIRTTDDEKAGWVTLIESLQKQERESRIWESKNAITPHGNKYAKPEHTIYTFVQGKTRSWDFMPLGATKPFATTTLSHLVEMAGTLGMYWKAFDVTRGDISAEGNGYSITSSQIRGLGLMTNFSITGSSKFEATRVIPSYEVKEFVFGFVPSILQNKRLLEVGSLERVKRLLATFSMDAKGIRLFEEKRNRRNLYPVTFELIAMLAEPLRLCGSSFRMLPNPTFDRWLEDSSLKISWVTAMVHYQTVLAELLQSMALSESGPHPLIVSISEHWKRTTVWRDCADAEMDIDMKESVHVALDMTTSYLRDPKKVKDDDILSIVTSHLRQVLDVSDDLEAAMTALGVSATATLIHYYLNRIRHAVVDAYPLASADVKRDREAIWLALIFRMICWFLLHDFDPADRNIIPSDLKGSRMPVFIG